MAKGFSIMDMMNEMSREEAAAGAETIERVSVFDIQPDEDNFYRLSSMEQLKNSIYAMGGVQQNLLLARLPAGEKYKYKALAGHRRAYACALLVHEGYTEFEYVPAVIKENISKDTEDMMLVMTNSTQRELTDWERVMQHMKLKEILPKLKKRQGLDGRTREIESDYLGVSQGQIAIYNTIGTRLDVWLMSVFKEGGIGISLAYEAAKLEPEEQKQLAQITVENGSFTEDDIKRLLGSRTIKGQLKITGKWAAPERETDAGNAENVSESDTSGKLPEASGTDGVENVSESDTFDEKREGHAAVPTAVENKETCHTFNGDDVDGAVYFIFRMDGFPEGKLQELLGAYRSDPNHIAAENVFRGMLPYGNGVVKVSYQAGYQVEYVHTGEIVRIPVHYFWKGFGREFAEELKAGDAAGINDVPEPGPFNREPAAGCGENGKRLKRRGGYEPSMVDSQIQKYQGYLELLGDDGELPRLVGEYNCLLDALELLRDTISWEEEKGENDESNNKAAGG